MADLTLAIGLNPSSIYAAFGDKHALFSLAVKRYMDSGAQYATKALEEPTLEKVIRALFDNTVAFLTIPGNPPSCMTLIESGTLDSIQITVTSNRAERFSSNTRK